MRHNYSNIRAREIRLLNIELNPYESKTVQIREIILGSYRIVYLFKAETVFILTVFHGSKLLKISDIY